MMGTKLRLWLPLVQCLIAAGLITSNGLRPDSIHSPSFIAPDIQLCAAINAPATVAKAVAMFVFWGRVTQSFYNHYPDLLSRAALVRINFLLDAAFYLVLIGVLWCLIGIEIENLGRDWLSFVTPK
ncbi:MAG TPA: hypothetical protein VGR50_02040, partial [Terriglobales bacterium]|nr:hypothetical protein [Terriglobales bacterium]